MVIVGPHWQCRHCGEPYIPADEPPQPAKVAATDRVKAG